MNDVSPLDFLSIKDWHREYGNTVFSSPKMLHYYIHPVERELLQAGALVRVCCRPPRVDQSIGEG